MSTLPTGQATSAQPNHHDQFFEDVAKNTNHCGESDVRDMSIAVQATASIH